VSDWSSWWIVEAAGLAKVTAERLQFVPKTELADVSQKGLEEGNYSLMCELVRSRTHAEAVVLIVLGGNRGNGVAVQGPAPAGMSVLEWLEWTAAKVRAASEQQAPHLRSVD